VALAVTSIRSTPVFWSETWSLALQALRANKMRAMLTMLGVIIGSGCIVLVVTVGLAGKRFIISEIEGVGSNLVLAEAVAPGVSQSLNVADQITPADLEAVKQGVPQVVQAAGTNAIPAVVSVNGAEHAVNLVGVTAEFQQIRRLLIVRGRYFDEDDMMTRSKVCLLTEPLAAEVFPNDDPVGKEIRVGDLHFTIIGIFRERVASFGETEITAESLIIPFTLLRDYTGTPYFKSFYARAARSEDVSMVTTAIQETLESRHRAGAQYRVWNLTSILDAARNISTALTVVLVGIALIALTISGIGIMNIMLVTVTERTREIGIRKAIGAPRDAILYQFLMEAIVISGTGALAGIGIAVSIPGILNFLIRLFPVPEGVTIPLSWTSVVVAFVVSCSTGLIFGYLPASRAARLQPTESLHYE
jgi:putative ABC transport system permease protein